jgi:hypothetical protein
MTRYTKEISLKQSTLRDQFEKLISHLGGLETIGLAEETREGVPWKRCLTCP